MAMRLKWTLLASIFLIMTATAPAGDHVSVIYVDADAPGSNNGSSWFHAYNYLQDGLDAAGPGQVVRVAQGIYRPNQTTIPTPIGRTATFQMKNAVTIEGGYAGYNTPQPWKRDVVLFETILSGDLSANDLPIPLGNASAILVNGPRRQDNAYSVVTASSVDYTAVLDGFTITGGNANRMDDAFPYAFGRGGGLFAFGGQPVIRQCTFKLNGAVDGGGAAYNYNSLTSYEHCTIQANYSVEYGAGISNWSADLDITNSVFIGNVAGNQAEGGGLYNYDSDPNILNCVFSGNFGGLGGGGMYSVYSDATVTACQFIGNTTSKNGGAVQNSTGSYPQFIDCVFVENQAPQWGGGMMNYYCRPTLVNCVFQSNHTSGKGGAFYSRYSEPNIANCLFSGNIANQSGGAIGNHDTAMEMTTCTFWANQAPQGRSIACESTGGPSSKSLVNISNSILWNPGNEIFNSDGSTINISYTTIAGGWIGVGNLNTAPLFVDPLGPDLTPGTEDDNLRLSAGSPCIDSADNTVVPDYLTMDLDHTARFKDDPASPNTGKGIPPIIDRGPYEFGGGLGGGGNRPVADAGEDQLLYARANNLATVYLDGSGSFDPDGDPLLYFWSWHVGGIPHNATGVNPVEQMPIGSHSIQLVVSDGINYSDPDVVTINIIAPIDVEVTAWPTPLYRSAPTGYLYASARLVGITQSEVDLDKSLTLYPGSLKATYIHISQSYDGGVPTTSLLGFFDREEFLDTVNTNGEVLLTLSGRLLTGQYFVGQDVIEIFP